MRESKVNNEINNKNSEFIYDKFEDDLKEIKEKLNSEKLSEDFKETLQAKMEAELNKNEEKKKFSFPNFTPKLATICASCILIFTSCFAFADEIENTILNIFGNSDKIIAKAIENGNYKEIDMDYVEDNGVSIKVDYVILENDELYIAFNVSSNEKFDKAIINKTEIRNQDEQILYTRNDIEENSTLTTDDINVESNKAIVINKLTNIKYKLENITKLNIEINKISFLEDYRLTEKNGNWKMEINI